MGIKNIQSGRSMVEMLGVLAIMGVLTIAAYGMYNFAMRAQRRNGVQDDVFKIVLSVRDKYHGYDDFSGIDSRVIFAEIGSNYRNKYEIAVNSADKRQFVVSLIGLDTNDCEYFATKAWPDSIEYRASNGKSGGATSIPNDCGDTAGKNKVNIIYGE